ncbi:segregation and condensation protein B [Cerasibacillus quisquiliarum]|uniref:Segregation and condensation protein B n=1 Tax=Cerasibacillus quisquiliarum TaxID=227865 RepID=A0A511UZ27_9BACI|nr:SMC-Scp complex subunit ScpB [Cerasibacillus quisquiliarum]MBB5145413.1 segregation and condensation protein B [Cerasibacillus quisquiliarum]GEN31849.1 segregation and condensation protein B [Cerasibacillus quisquiliarum]
MEIPSYRAVIEGLLFASGDEGVTVKQIAEIIETTESTVLHILNELAYDYEHTDRGVMLTESRGVYYLTTKPEHSEYYKKLLETPHTTQMSQAALETLAIIAYKQPITRTEIEEIRGVKSDRPVQTLLSRGLIEEVGRKNTIGRPMLFATTKDFLTYFGLTSLDELPPLPEDLTKEDIEKETHLFFKNMDDANQNKIN